MTEQPTALWLADAMSLSFPGNLGIDKAAAELRRLAEVEAQRDALLEALKLMLEQFTKTPSTLKDSEARIKAHAAIAQTEGQ